MIYVSEIDDETGNRIREDGIAIKLHICSCKTNFSILFPFPAANVTKRSDFYQLILFLNKEIFYYKFFLKMILLSFVKKNIMSIF